MAEIGISGGRRAMGSLAMPAETPAPAVMPIHEWRSLNDQIKAVAAELAKAGYAALAVDLYGRKLGTTPKDAKASTAGVDGAVAAATLDAWNAWLRDHIMTTDRPGAAGWCFGGGWGRTPPWSRRSTRRWSITAAWGAEFGGVSRSVEALGFLEGPVPGHYATRDGWINQGMMAGFEKRMTAANKPNTSHWYEADHAFADPTIERYDAQDMILASARTLNFLASRRRGGGRAWPIAAGCRPLRTGRRAGP